MANQQIWAKQQNASKKKISNLVLNKGEYEQRIDKAVTKECVSKTLKYQIFYQQTSNQQSLLETSSLA